MKKALLIATGLILFAVPALGQSSNDTDERGRSYDRRDRDDLEELLRSIDDATVAVRCDPQENMRACVEATTTLLERARSALLPGGAPTTPPPPR
jgi:hypothetical protein